MRQIPVALLAAAALALAAAGCGGGSNNNDNSGASGGASTQAAQTPAQTTTTASSGSAEESDKGGDNEIRVQNFAFSPADKKVKVGEKIEWENYDTTAHNVVATSGGSFKSDTLQKGDKFEFTPTKAGTISYVCTFHPNMKATLEVTQ
jgi:plastocyanin